MNQTTSTKSKETKTLRRVNKALKQSRKVAMVNVPPEAKKVVKTAERSRRPVKASHLSRWAEALAKPFDCIGAICPVNFNPAPSLMNTTLRLTHTSLNTTVGANTTLQLTIFPGHGKPVNSLQFANISGSNQQIGSQMDAVAYHSCQYNGLLTDAGNWHVGAVNTGSGAGVTFTAFNVVYNSIALGASTNGAANSGVVGLYDSVAPYSSSIASHLRWQLVSCGVRIFNTTPQLNRGGNVTTVQLVNAGGFRRQDGVPASTQAELEINPSFKIHGDCGEGMEISWIPRLQDLAYWHSIVSTDANTSNITATDYSGAAMGIFLNNNTGVTQSYVIQMVFNFMIAGTTVQAISNPSVVEPILRAPIEQTVTHLANTSSTASTAPHVAAAATSSPSEGQSMFEKLSGKAYQMAMHGAHAVGEGIASRVMGRAGPPDWGVLVPRRH